MFTGMIIKQLKQCKNNLTSNPFNDVGIKQILILAGAVISMEVHLLAKSMSLQEVVKMADHVVGSLPALTIFVSQEVDLPRQRLTIHV